MAPVRFSPRCDDILGGVVLFNCTETMESQNSSGDVCVENDCYSFGSIGRIDFLGESDVDDTNWYTPFSLYNADLRP
jgi:hypothetical protein